ncbi:MAG TPA: MBL fold metallo-hydrolase [Vicinamibacteria bacterium]|nr:MBL fold metallo-hydrolase [Vicinamibacteria bacterium]
MAKLTFLGAARTVTGSQYLLEAGGRRLLVDSGMFQGEKELRLRNWREPEFPPAGVDAVVLTHTHLDHIGRLPRLVKQGFRGLVYCTPPTRDLAEILLLDAAHLQQEDAGYLNRKGLTKHSPALPLFDETDVREAMELFRPVPLGRPQQVNHAFSFAYRDAGHLLGAASADVLVREDGRETRVLFSGDVGRFDAVLTRDPDLAPDADYMVVESTYGNRAHPDLSVLEQLEGVIKKTFARGGVLLIPAFAVGRAQQMVWLMDQLVTEGRVRAFPIHIDSPMAIDASRIYASYPEAHRVSLNSIGGRSLLHGKWIHLHRTRAESEALNNMKGPAVIISSSGMLAGGRILHHCRQRLPHPENTLLITGFQAAGTLGRALLDGAHVVRIHKGDVPVLAEIRDLKGLSGHADAGEMMRWLSGVRGTPQAVFVTHGEADAAEALASRIARERGFPASVPAMGDSVDLAPGAGGGPGPEVL